MNRMSLAVVGLLAIPWLSCFAEGFVVDKEECRKAEANAVEFKRRSFERMGAKLDAPKARYDLETEQ